MSPPRRGHASESASPTRAISFAQEIPEVSKTPGYRCRCLRGGGAQAMAPEPANHTAADLLGDRGQPGPGESAAPGGTPAGRRTRLGASGRTRGREQKPLARAAGRPTASAAVAPRNERRVVPIATPLLPRCQGPVLSKSSTLPRPSSSSEAGSGGVAGASGFSVGAAATAGVASGLAPAAAMIAS